MSSSTEDNNLEGNFGDELLNKTFEELNEGDKKDLLKMDKSIQKNVLKIMVNPEIKKYYDELPEDKKLNYDKKNIVDKYFVLDMKYNNEKKSKIKKKMVKPIEDDNQRETDIMPVKEQTNLPDSLEIHKKRSDEKQDEDVTKLVEQEIFENENEVIEEEKDERDMSPSERFEKLIKYYIGNNLHFANKRYNHELEVRFGTKELRGIKRLTKNDYDNVVKVLKTFGFQTQNPLGTPSLKVRCEFLDRISGKFKMSDIRTEIEGIVAIEAYCKSNDIKTVYNNISSSTSVKFVRKHGYITKDKKFMRPVDMNDFNFRVSLQTEESATKGIENFIIDNRRQSKKEFRYLNRVSFVNPNYPFRVDLSIVKTGNRGRDKRGFNNIIPVNTLEESNIFNNPESYEIEIEFNQEYGTKIGTPNEIISQLRKIIKYVLIGLQGTMYPVSYVEQNEIIDNYMEMIWEKEYDPSRRISSRNFIGPNSITLQLTNIAPLDENSSVPNIRKDFVVTDKADGERHLLYISKHGKIYLIGTNMDIKFTGAKTLHEECFNTLIDGELIKTDKLGNFINLYAAFDIYYYKNKDARHLPLFETENDKIKYKDKKEKDRCRFDLLEKIIKLLNPVSVMYDTRKQNKIIEVSPIRIELKNFYPSSAKQQTIFEGCKTILEKEKQGLFEYEIDGLIFTHIYYGVGSNVVGKAGLKTKITWENSFKWKPPQYNTVDFLVTTTKNVSGEDVIKTIYEDGISASSAIQNSEYKIIELRCGFSERNDGFINPMQDIIDDKIPEYKPIEEDRQDNDYMPRRFYPTDPYNPNAGLCNIMLKMDDTGTKHMFTKEGEAFGDNTIVEFAYNLDAEEGWGWEPLRLRHDKTGKLRRGEREYGNSYKVCNENWKSIHPTGRITEDMLMTGDEIPDVSISEDIYYNTPSGKLKTEGLKNFHNLYVKKLLITGVSNNGDTLIDFACGKAGDLPKWIAAKLSFVFGVDYSNDNIDNRLDGACVRYLKAKRLNKRMPDALFVNGNSANNIRDGTAMLNDKAKRITHAVFGDGPKDAEQIGKGVARLYGKGDGGFNVSSCQFAIHYFFKTPDMLREFLRNVAECTKINGYFIGTSYDGKVVFDKIKKIKKGESIQIMEDGKKIWELYKNYDLDGFEADSSSIGYEINVYQESINQYISEYLVNYDYFDRLMDAYGFKLISIDEANAIGLPSGSGMFSELFINMLDEIKKNKYKATLFGDAPNMTKAEKELSFLNRYFVYKKVRDVNIEKLNLEIGEYEESLNKREQTETQRAVVVAKEETVKLRTKIRKLPKKLMLIAATDAVDDGSKDVKAIEEAIKKTDENKLVTENDKPKKKRLLIINDNK